MKKILVALLVLMLALTLVACGGTTDETTLPDETDPVVGPDVQGDHTHAFVETVVVAPTCTSLGKSAKQCSCGEIEAGSEMPLPFAEHDADAATCTADSVCKVCGKMLVEKYGHNLVETVVSVATCTTTGETTTKCSRCGENGETKIVPAGHDFDFSTLAISKGAVSAKCKKCGTNSALTEKSTIVAFNFDTDASEFDNSGRKITKPDAAKFEGGAFQPAGAFLISYTADDILTKSKVLVSFDFKLAEAGKDTRGESMFTFVSTPSQTYSWLAKYYEVSGRISTSSANDAAAHNDANSYPISRNKWYNFTAIIDVEARTANVYVDGHSIGTVSIPNHADAKHNGQFSFRLYDMMPNNGTSNPYFDNFKIVEIN